MPQLANIEKALRFGEGRRLKRLRNQADYVATLEPDFEALSDAELAGKTAEFRQRIDNGEPVDDLIFEAFAAVREAAKRTLGQRHFDVQVMGAIVLHEGDIAEMKTGEGKTLVATMPLYLNALPGTGVHLVTVNDYLAKRDAEWMGPVYEKLGMRSELHPQHDAVHRAQGGLRGRHHLRHELRVRLRLPARQHGRRARGPVQRSHTYAIVDEVDSILIDEARTPLIISGEPETAAQIYYEFARVAKTLVGEQSKLKTKGQDEMAGLDVDYLYDEKHKTVSPGEGAIEKVERALGVDNLYDPSNGQLVNHLIQALKAQALYKRDVEYVIEDGEVKIVDEFTGRIMEGRRWSEGLHQAIEAKEGVAIQEENVTLATITLQNYFRLYEKLGGMTGTAKTEEKEFVEIYGLHVVEIPTNVDVARADQNDYIYKTKDARFNAVVEDIVERHESGQPVLVGTIAVETSEYLSQLLTRRGIKHNVLNAKAARARGGDHQGRGPARRGHDRDQHGRPRRRHQARRGRGRGRRPVRARHRAPRGAPHRQPAARPLRPPGRPRRVALLPLRPGRPRAPVRRRPHLQHHRPLQDPGGPAHGGEDPLEPDRERAEEGRGAELRRAEERPQVRRRHERAAPGDLRAAPARARGRGPLGGHQGLDRGGRRARRHRAHRWASSPRSGTWPSS